MSAFENITQNAHPSSHKEIPQLTAPHNKRTMNVIFHALVKLVDADAKTEVLLPSFLRFFLLLQW